MEIFYYLSKFFFDLLDICVVYIDGLRFSLGGAVIFAVLVICAMSVIAWLFGLDD